MTLFVVDLSQWINHPINTYINKNVKKSANLNILADLSNAALVNDRRTDGCVVYCNLSAVWFKYSKF